MTDVETRPGGEWLYRDAQPLGVNFPERTIDLIVMPYGEDALVPYQPQMGRPAQGRAPGLVFERTLPGSFDGLEKRANRIRVNRDHSRERTVGRAVAFRPDDERGLFARVRISRTPLGDETLELANDESLDASAGFLPMPGGARWLDREHVEYSRCWLGHIAMTPEPAHPNARVLAVRHESGPVADPPGGSRAPTPNLDVVRGWLLEKRYGA